MSRLDEETLETILSTLRDYAADELTPEVLLRLDHDDEFPMKVLRDLYDPSRIGLHLLFVEEAHGGLGGGAYDIYRVSAQMAAIDLGIATGVLATFLGADPILFGGGASTIICRWASKSPQSRQRGRSRSSTTRAARKASRKGWRKSKARSRRSAKG